MEYRNLHCHRGFSLCTRLCDATMGLEVFVRGFEASLLGVFMDICPTYYCKSVNCHGSYASYYCMNFDVVRLEYDCQRSPDITKSSLIVVFHTDHRVLETNSEMTTIPFKSLPIEIRYLAWEYTWPPPMVIEPVFNWNYDQDYGSSNDGGDSDNLPGVILHPGGTLSTYPDNTRRILGWDPTRIARSQLPVALSVCQESREFTLRHYHHLYHREFTAPNFYFNPKRDILYFNDSRVYDHLSTLRRSYGELIFRCTAILIYHSIWEDEKLRRDRLRSSGTFAAVDSIFISDRETVRGEEHDDGFCLVPDSDKIIARANRCRSEYERYLVSLEKLNQNEVQGMRYGNAARILFVDCWGNLY